MALAPTVSVVVPVFNRADLVSETLESILAQTYRPEPEILVVDDGSTDDTPRVLARYSNRIRVLRQENQGVSVARNQALQAGTGELIAFCDSDDLWLPGKLERQIALASEHPQAGMIYGDYLCFEDDGARRRQWRMDRPRPAGFILPPLLERNFIVPSSVMVPRRVIDSIGGFDPDCCNAEDYDFFLRIALRYEVACSDQVVCYYRQHSFSASRQREQYWKGFLCSLYKAWRGIREMDRDGTLRNPVDGTRIAPGRVREWEAVLRRRIASFHLRLAKFRCRRGLPVEAWREAARALRLQPFNPKTWTVIWRILRLRLGFKRTA